MPFVNGTYQQLAEILAQLEPEKLSSLQASPVLQERFEFLAGKRHDGVLSIREKDELDHFIVLERLIRLAKIRADNPLGLHP